MSAGRVGARGGLRPSGFRRTRTFAVIGALLAGLTAIPSAAGAAATGGGGGLVVTTVDVAGSVLVGTCVELYADAGAGSRGALVKDSARCDQPVSSRANIRGTPDGATDGTIAWTGLAPGAFVVHETLPPGLAGTAATYELAADATVTIRTASVARHELEHRLTGGITIRKTDPGGQVLPGACFGVKTRDRLARSTFLCDGPSRAGLPGDGKADGLLLFVGLTPTLGPTPYTLAEVLAPAGYLAVADQVVTADPATPTELRIVDTTGPGGGVAARTVDPAGTLLVGACFELWTDAGDGTRGAFVKDSARCDGPAGSRTHPGTPDGALDGVVAWTGITGGRYLLHETFAPALAGTAATYELVVDAPIRVSAETVVSVEFVHRPTAGLTLHKTDSEGQPLAGACFGLSTKAGLITRTVVLCDGDAPQGSGMTGDGAADGLLVFTALAPTGGATTYLLRELQPPPGYATAPDQQVVADPAKPTELTIRDATGGGGGLVVTTVDVAGSVLVGTCVELYADAGAGSRGALVKDSARCDQPVSSRANIRGTPDGATDGTIAWTGLAPGAFVVHETLPPGLAGTAATYELAADATVTIRTASVARHELEHRLTGGITIRKTDPGGQVLPGACFGVKTRDRLARSTFLCDGPSRAGLPGDGKADGLLLFVGLTPTLGPTPYTLAEVLAPAGYLAVADQVVTADPATPTELRIVDTTGPGGGVAASLEVTALALEIDSEIEIRAFNAMKVAGGVTTATGRIDLNGPAGSGPWSGTGTLASNTSSGTAACPSIHLSGAGTYDWVVRGVHAGPEVPASEITVDMDSGPINESPDKWSMDGCSGTTFDGTMNTWENLFFDAYRSRYQAAGFRVDNWTFVDGGAAWKTGGLVAEANWTATCATSLVLDCTDRTTLRLYVTVTANGPQVTPVATQGSGDPIAVTPGSSEGAIAATAGPGASGGIGPSGPGVDCGVKCGGLPLLPIVIGGLVLIVGAGLFFLRLFGSNQVVKVEGPDLTATGNDVPISPIDIAKIPPLEMGKLPPIDFEKIQPIDPTLAKLEPIDPTLAKIEPIDPTLAKLEPIDPTLAKIEPIDPTLAKLDKLQPIEAPLAEPGGDVKLGSDPLQSPLEGDLPPPPHL